MTSLATLSHFDFRLYLCSLFHTRAQRQIDTVLQQHAHIPAAQAKLAPFLLHQCRQSMLRKGERELFRLARQLFAAGSDAPVPRQAYNFDQEWAAILGREPTPEERQTAAEAAGIEQMDREEVAGHLGRVVRSFSRSTSFPDSFRLLFGCDVRTLLPLAVAAGVGLLVACVFLSNKKMPPKFISLLEKVGNELSRNESELIRRVLDSSSK